MVISGGLDKNMIEKENLKIGMTVFFYIRENFSNIKELEIYKSEIENITDYYGAIIVFLKGFERAFGTSDLFENYNDGRSFLINTISEKITIKEAEIKQLRDKLSQCFKQEETDLK